ncbi:siderophore-interacting protein [Aliamphritea hakodatensis]|uniref:siderophore-interacting protein n=1 Tax=Aliamphritea hakodatensis TaxID=2895352 RepID=UPI0022FD5662|nr:siderophore-interacting protein [Aliamphritea hakodatensis]
MRTPIQDHDHKTDIIDHVNQDHSEELLTIANAHSPDRQVHSAGITDIYQEGIQVCITPQGNQNAYDAFIPFEIEGDLEEKILYSAYAAIVKQGGSLSGSRKRFFEVTATTQLTPNFTRLTVRSATPFPEYYPGYAFGFMLKTIKSAPKQASEPGNIRWLQQAGNRFFIWLMKRLSSNRRQKMLTSINKNVRLYTLRKAWQTPEDTATVHYGQIDIFTHGDSPGSLWSGSLNTGDIVMTRSESADKHPHLATGQALLIADETAFPALAAILEHWHNPVPPYVITLSTLPDEQNYFSDVRLPADAQLHQIICPAHHQAEEVLKIIARLSRFETVWAAMEADAAKAVRHHLRNVRNIQGKHNHTKGYWRLRAPKAG